MITVDQIAASQKANLETFYGLTHSAFAGFEKMVELNLTATKAALSETMGHAHAAMGVKDAQELMALQAGLIQPLAEKSVSYSRHLYDIATSTGAQFGKAMEDKSVEAQKTFANLIDSAAKTHLPVPRPLCRWSKAPWPPAKTPWNPCKRLSSKPPTWLKPISTP